MFKEKFGVSPCSACRRLEYEMNKAGPALCREKVDKIVSAIDDNRDLVGSIIAKFAGLVPRPARLAFLRMEVLAAIGRWEEKTRRQAGGK